MAIQLLGIDCSIYQDDNSTPQMMNFKKSREAGANFVFIKVSQANYLDQDFVMNWSNAKYNGLPRGGYHFLDWTLPAKDQAKTFCGALKGDRGEITPVIDFECRTGAVKGKTVSELKMFAKIVQDTLYTMPIIYTGPSYWKEFGSNESSFALYGLWIANYYVAAPSIPSPWTAADFWQFTPKGDGLKFGAESKSLDMDYCLTPEKYGLKVLTPKPEPTDAEKLKILWDAHPDLH